MDLPVIEMPEEQAKEAFTEYRTAVLERPRTIRDEADREYAEIDKAVMRGYRELGKGHQLIELPKAIVAGGLADTTVDTSYWREGREVRQEITISLPALAVCRADARTCWTKGVSRDGGVSFVADEWVWSPRKADRIYLADGSFDADATRPTNVRPTFRAVVPTIPPPFRPPHKLSGYHLLWEAEWNAAAPVDPALLKHLGGDLYVVLAVWELTALERAVLSGMRQEA